MDVTDLFNETNNKMKLMAKFESFLNTPGKIQ